MTGDNGDHGDDGTMVQCCYSEALSFLIIELFHVKPRFD